MTTVLYADVLFIINFSMDFISLCLTAKILTIKHRLIRYVSAAAVGATAATLMTAYSVEGAAGGAATFVLSVVMTVVAYGAAPAKKVAVRALALWGSGALIGGTVTALCSFGERAPISETVGETNRVWGFLAVGVLIAWGIVRLIRPKLARTSAEVTISLEGRAVSGEALVDSGALVCDPVSGDAVIFISRPIAEELLGKDDAKYLCETRVDEISGALRGRVRVIPTTGIVARGVCSAFRPDRVEVMPDKTPRRALAAVIDVPADHFGGFGILLPSVLS